MEYSFETFHAENSRFDKEFTSFLNGKSRDNWSVRECGYCHDQNELFASCLFERG